MMKTVLKILFVFILVTLPLQAGSYFSSFSQGVGLRLYWTDARGIGMGGTGLATADSMALPQYNTALWRHIDKTRAYFSMQYNRHNIDVAGFKFTRATGNFGGLSLAIPIKKNRWVLGASLYPYTDVGFEITQRNNFNDLVFDESIFLDGNINRAQLILIWSPHPKIGIAVNGSYYFGLIQDRFVLRFEDNSFFDSSHEIKYQFQGAGIGFSVDFQPTSWLTLGGFVDFKPSLDVERIFDSPISNETIKVTRSAFLPLQFGIGSGFRLSKRWVAALDGSYQRFSKGFGFQNQSLKNFQDWYFVGVGFERKQKQVRGKVFQKGRKLFDKIDLRTGFSISQLGYKFNGSGVKEYAGHFGLGIPFFFGVNRLDMGIRAGIRGNKKLNLAEEKFIQVLISVSVGELWFQRPR